MRNAPLTACTELQTSAQGYADTMAANQWFDSVGPDGSDTWVRSEGYGGTVVGDLGLGALVDGDLPVSIDTRSLYSVALDWLGGPTDTVLGGNFDRYGILR